MSYSNCELCSVTISISFFVDKQAVIRLGLDVKTSICRSDSSLTVDRGYPASDGGRFESVVECGERQTEAKGQFEICGIVGRKGVSTSQMNGRPERVSAGVFVGIDGQPCEKFDEPAGACLVQAFPAFADE